MERIADFFDSEILKDFKPSDKGLQKINSDKITADKIFQTSPVTDTISSISNTNQTYSCSEQDLNELWQDVSKLVQSQIDTQQFSAWLKPLSIKSLALPNSETDFANIELNVANKFIASHLESNYLEILNSSFSKILFAKSKVRFSINPQLVSNIILEKKEPLVQSAKTTSGNRHYSNDKTDATNLNPKYNFSNFVVGSCNQFAHAVSLKISESLGASYNPLFIYGGVGLGKTHLANAIGNSTRRKNKKVLLVSSETFVSELISSLRSNKMDLFKSKFRSLDLLIIDDIQFIIGKERTQEEFFHTFNELYNKHKQIIITADKLPQELLGLEDRLKTRFASGLSVDLQAPDYETRVAILAKKAATEGIVLPESVARFVADKVCSNVRELEGALNKISAFSSVQNKVIDLDLAQEVIKTITANIRSKEVTFEIIQKIVAERFNVSLNDLLGKRRTQNIASARHVCMYLCRKLTAHSFPEIGAFFGGRDHSTAIHAYKLIAEKCNQDASFQQTIISLEDKISK